MKKVLFTMIVTLGLSGCFSTLQVQVDYNPSYKFSSLSTFSVVYQKKGDDYDFSRSRIAQLLAKHFKEKGYTQVEKKDADFYVMFHVHIKKISEIQKDYETLGLQPINDYSRYIPDANNPYRYANRDFYPYGNTYQRETTRTYEYEESRFVVDLMDVKANDVFWQSIAEDEIVKRATQKEKSKYYNRVLNKMFSSFPKKGH